MPEFTKPTEFVETKATLPRVPATAADMTGILAEHVQRFIESPLAYAGLPEATAAALFDNIEVFTDFEQLRASNTDAWIFVTPAPAFTTAQRIDGLPDLGASLVNSSMPASSQVFFRPTAVGRMQSKSLCLIERSVLVAVCTAVRAGTFRVADSLYLWLSDCIPVLRMEFAALGVTMTPVRSPEEGERPLFAPFSGNPVVIGITSAVGRQVEHNPASPP